MNDSTNMSTSQEFDHILLQTLLESSDDGILVVDEHGTIVSFNQRICTMWNIPSGAADSDTSAHIADLVSRSSMGRGSSDDLLKRHCGAQSETLDDEITIVDGRTFPLSSVPLIGAPGSCLGRVLYVEDRAKDVSAIEREPLLNEQLRAILDASPTMIFFKDTENRFIRVNEALARANGRLKEEIEGKTCWDIYPKDSADQYWRDDKEVMASGNAKVHIVEKMEGPSGAKWLETDKVLYRNAKGEVVGIIGFSTDITERRRSQQELLEKADELEKMNKFLIGRELKMVELKEELSKCKMQSEQA